jgi:predicted TPR repeat methyltransferase
MLENETGKEPAQAGEGTTMTLAEALALAVGTHREGRFEEAAAIYKQILDVDPDNTDALHFLGVAVHQAGRAKAALGFLDRALELEPDHPDALGNRGNVHRSLCNLELAEADYRRALELRPDDPNILGNLGTVLRARGDLEGAVTMYRAVIAKKPDHASTWQNMASALDALERRAEAVAAYREAARLSPGSADLFRDMGVALYLDGHLAEAVEMYRRCLALAPDDPRALHLLAAATGQGAPARASDGFVRAEFDNFAPRFDTKLAALEYCGPTIVAQAVATIAAELAPLPAVLDAGCGTGLCAPLLRPRAATLVGVDLSPGMIEEARKRGGYDALIVDELTAYLRGQPRAYDLIVSADTLVYFGDLGQILPAAAGALKPGGFFIFTLERSEPGEAPAGFHLHAHGRYSHTRDYVSAVLREAGFVEAAITEVSSRKEVEVPVPGWLIRARLAAGS